MKIRATSYTFDASEKTVTCASFSSLESIQLITNVTDNIIIYNFADATKGGSLTSTTLTLAYDTTSMSDTDKLQIFIEDGSATEAISGTVTANLGATDNAVLDDIAAKLATIDADTSTLAAGVSTEYQVDIVGSLPAGTNAIGKLAANSGVDIGDVDVTSIVPGVGATNLGKAIDTATGATDTGVLTLATRDDALSSLTPAEGDNVQLRTDSTGALWVKPSSTVTVDGSGVTQPISHAALTELAAAINSDKVDVNVVSGSAAGTEYTEDAASAANPAGGALILIREDARAGSLTTTDGDNVAARGNNKGELYVKTTDSDALLTTIDGDTSNISTKIDTLAGAVSGTEMQVDVLTMPTTTIQGTVTANLSATDNAVLDNIDADLTTIIGHVDGLEALIGTTNTTLTTIDGRVDGIEGLLTTIDGDTGNLATIKTNTDFGTVTGGGTEAGALRVTIASDSTGVLSIDDNGGAITVDGTVTANAGTNLNTSALALETGGNLAAIATSLGNIDNSVDGNYLNVNLNVAGTDVAANAGTLNAQTVRVTIATDDEVNNLLGTIDADTSNLAKALAPTAGGPTIDSYAHAAISTTANTANQSIVSAPGLNKQIWVYGINYVVGTAAGTVSFQDEDDTAITGVMSHALNSGLSTPPSGNFSMPIWKVATNKALEVDTVTCDIEGWIDYAIVSV